MSIAAPVVSVFLLRLAPCVVAAVGFGLVGSHVAASPQHARWQTQVNRVRMVFVGTKLIN